MGRESRPIVEREAKSGTGKTMNKTTIIAMLTIIGSVCAFSTLGGQERFQKLTGSQIQARLSGMELTDESHWGEVFDRNGTLRIYSMGHKSIGKWRVQKGQLCLDHGKEPGGGCYEVWLAGNKVELRNKESSLPLEGVLQKPTDR
jgi:hypothetical protein